MRLRPSVETKEIQVKYSYSHQFIHATSIDDGRNNSRGWFAHLEQEISNSIEV